MCISDSRQLADRLGELGVAFGNTREGMGFDLTHSLARQTEEIRNLLQRKSPVRVDQVQRAGWVCVLAPRLGGQPSQTAGVADLEAEVVPAREPRAWPHAPAALRSLAGTRRERFGHREPADPDLWRLIADRLDLQPRARLGGQLYCRA